MDGPALVAVDVQDEDVVDVIVIGEPLILCGRDVGIDLHWVPERARQVLTPPNNRVPRAVQALQDHRCPVGKQAQHLVVADLIAHPGSHAATDGVCRLRQRFAVLRHANERGAQTTPAQQFVDGVKGEEVCKIILPALDVRRQLRRCGPVLSREGFQAAREETGES